MINVTLNNRFEFERDVAKRLAIAASKGKVGVVASDEKWIRYNNAKRKKSWVRSGEPSTATPQQNIHEKKTMLCKMLLLNFNRALKEKLPQYAKKHDKTIFLHDNMLQNQ
ncbi:hypothetical protein ILUMI_00597 [Ignelater luminosus]|uniref:Transposase n=1 Tax=Ignelater luminosus TaxID=2038154 RepID=A0A8K0GMH3_IGNLU|nr:hypothetical protein ILUMI_00597 [Ignelater luminosus]